MTACNSSYQSVTVVGYVYCTGENDSAEYKNINKYYEVYRGRWSDRELSCVRNDDNSFTWVTDAPADYDANKIAKSICINLCPTEYMLVSNDTENRIITVWFSARCNDQNNDDYLLQQYNNYANN